MELLILMGCMGCGIALGRPLIAVLKKINLL